MRSLSFVIGFASLEASFFTITVLVLRTLNLSISSLFFAKCFKGLGFLISYEYELQIMEIREAVEEAADSQSLNKIQSQVLLGPLLIMFDGNINSEWLE